LSFIFYYLYIMIHPSIVINIHICQKGLWTIPFDMIMSEIKSSGLYNECKEIRLGIVNDNGVVIDNKRFNDPKIKIISWGYSDNYERVTLHNMIKSSQLEDVQYLYCHTKGIKYFESNDTHTKNCVMDWIKLLIHFNIKKWITASQCLMKYDTYGCEFSRKPKKHYSGNFWWANSQYIRTLPKVIGNEYCDPEFWLLQRDKVLMMNIFSSGIDAGDHYRIRFPKKGNY